MNYPTAGGDPKLIHQGSKCVYMYMYTFVIHLTLALSLTLCVSRCIYALFCLSVFMHFLSMYALVYAAHEVRRRQARGGEPAEAPSRPSRP